MIFAVAFLGALFAILVALLVIYTYVTLRLFPRLKRSFGKFVEEVGPQAVFERANLDPVEAMRQLGVSPAAAAASIASVSEEVAQRQGAVRVIFTCEDHGRCSGCPKVLAQFEAIIKHQGEQSFDEVERKCYAQLQTLRQSSPTVVEDKEHVV